MEIQDILRYSNSWLWFMFKHGTQCSHTDTHKDFFNFLVPTLGWKRTNVDWEFQLSSNSIWKLPPQNVSRPIGPVSHESSLNFFFATTAFSNKNPALQESLPSSNPPTRKWCSRWFLRFFLSPKKIAAVFSVATDVFARLMPWSFAGWGNLGWWKQSWLVECDSVCANPKIVGESLNKIKKNPCPPQKRPCFFFNMTKLPSKSDRSFWTQLRGLSLVEASVAMRCQALMWVLWVDQSEPKIDEVKVKYDQLQ